MCVCVRVLQLIYMVDHHGNNHNNMCWKWDELLAQAISVPPKQTGFGDMLVGV